MGFALVLLAPLIYARLMVKPDVVWRGRKYRLDAHARLAHAALRPR